MTKKRVLSIDLESFSDVSLPDCGVYRYVEGDFHILLFAYAFDDEETKCVDMACGEELPQKVVDAILMTASLNLHGTHSLNGLVCQSFLVKTCLRTRGNARWSGQQVYPYR